MAIDPSDGIGKEISVANDHKAANLESSKGAIDKPLSAKVEPFKGPKSFNSQTPFELIDFTHPVTLKNLCALFGEVSPAEIGLSLGALTASGAVEKSDLKDSLDCFYEPLAIVYLGLNLKTKRGEEFRRWFKDFFREVFFKPETSGAELLKLRAERDRFLDKARYSESFNAKIKREYQKIKEKLKESQLELENQTISAKKESSKLEKLYQEIVRLENDLRRVTKWPYPVTIEQALEAGEELYSSKLAFVSSPNRVEVPEPTLASNSRLTAEAVKMIKALALVYHPMKFKYGGTDPIRFKNETGLDLNLSTSLRDMGATLCARIVRYRGQNLSCYDYLQTTIDNYRLLVHFGTLKEEKKILISHFTVFALAGLYRLVPGPE
ncbi:MAG: hypothetical protein LBV23_10925 [Deltaproteobacteria bacterium]|jgi:hypothetical protein|nr:hypothetical protein [Deltaproteobacteria bacterium]